MTSGESKKHRIRSKKQYFEDFIKYNETLVVFGAYVRIIEERICHNEAQNRKTTRLVKSSFRQQHHFSFINEGYMCHIEDVNTCTRHSIVNIPENSDLIGQGVVKPIIIQLAREPKKFIPLRWSKKFLTVLLKAILCTVDIYVPRSVGKSPNSPIVRNNEQ